MTTKKLTDYIKQSISVQGTKKEEQPKPAQARIRFKKETELQETPIGKIPKEWKVVKLSDVAEIRGNKSINKVNKIAFIPMELIPDSGVFVRYEIRDLDDVSSFTYCEAGDILLAKITPSFENGKQGIVPDDVPNRFALTTTEVYPIACKQVNRLFLFYILKHPKFRKILEHSMRGTTGRRRVPRDALENLEMPIPPLSEQKVIAEILSTVDSAIDGVRGLVERAEKLKKGLMQELFTKGIGHKEYKETPIGKIPKDWKIAKLGSICRFKRGFSYRSTDITDERTSLRFITIDDIEKEGGLKRYAKKVYIKNPSAVDPEFLLNNGDILIANTDMTKGFIIGAPILIKNLGERCAYSMDLTRLIFDKTSIHSEFLYYYLMHPQVRRFMKSSAQGTNVLHLNHEIIKNLLIPIPSLKEQKVIAEILYTVDEYIRMLRARLERLEHVKKWLMDVLLTGKVRVMVEPSSGGSSG